MARQLTVELVGDASKLEKSFKNIASEADEMADKVVDDAKRAGRSVADMGDKIGNAESPAMGLADVMDGLGTAFGLPIDGAITMARAAGDLTGGFANLAPAISGVGTALKGALLGPVGIAIGVVAALALGIKLLWDNCETFRDVVTSAFQAVMSVVGPILQKIGDAVGWVADKLGLSSDKSSEKAEEMATRVSTALDALKTAYEDMRGRVQSVFDGIVTGMEVFNHQNETSLATFTANLKTNVKEYENWLEDIRVITEKYGNDVGQHFIDLGAEGHGLADQMANASIQVGNETAAMIRKMAAARQEGNALAALLSNAGVFVDTGNILAAARRQHGGPVSGGHPYLVGEAGPELFVPNSGGMIHPSGSFGGLSGGSTTIALNLDGQQITQVVIDGLYREERRSGVVSALVA